MKKPVWIRVLGWIALASVVVGIIIALLGYSASGDNVDMARAIAGGFLAPVFVGGPCFALWVIFTIIHKLMAHNARLKAQAWSEITPRAPSVVVQPQAAPAPPKARTGPLGL